MPDRVLHLRKLAPAEWKDLRRIRLDALKDSPEAFAAQYDVEAERTEAAWRRTFDAGIWLIARAGPEAVGLAYSVADPQRRWIRNLEAIWVRPSHRRQGVLRALISDLIKRADNAGVVELGLWVLADNLEAREVYGRLGFEPTGETGSAPGEPGRVELRMRLRLGGWSEPGRLGPTT
jgi:GNAT superfamily N-acetyltransferase